MSTARFFVDQAMSPAGSIELPSAVAHHATRVLRLRDGEAIVLFNGRGGEYSARLLINGERAQAAIESFERIERESPLAISLIQSLVANDKMDWIIEKAVELGVARIVVVPSERAVVKLDGERGARRLAHWRDIVIAACAQSGRNQCPAIELADSLSAAFAASSAMARFILAPGAAGRLTDAAAESVAIAIGPEGGFSESEIAAARRYGFAGASLGPRVLRTETAGLAAIAALQTRDGDLIG